MPQRYDLEGYSHYLTFSCYKRLWLFKDEYLCQLFITHLAEAREGMKFKLWAFVIMLSHIHMLIQPQSQSRISDILHNLKRLYSVRALRYLRESRPELAAKLMVKVGSKAQSRFWQAGGGYDRNVFGHEALRKAIDYIHNNPVRAKLVKTPEEWQWSSARFWMNGNDEPMKMDIPELF